jgi:hypothetical protein
MVKRIKINDPIQQVAERLTQLGCLPHQIQKHIDALHRPKSPPRHYHLSEHDGRWLRQLAERPLLMDGEGNGRLLGWKKLVGRV